MTPAEKLVLATRALRKIAKLWTEKWEPDSSEIYGVAQTALAHIEDDVNAPDADWMHEHGGNP